MQAFSATHIYLQSLIACEKRAANVASLRLPDLKTGAIVPEGGKTMQCCGIANFNGRSE
jgi:hypothetical protein